jgi:hypothetical protein
MTIQNNGNIFQNGSLIHSDRRFKRAIRPIDGALVKINKLQGVAYAFDPQRFAKNATPKGLHLGLIAQEVEKIFPQLVKERPKWL